MNKTHVSKPPESDFSASDGDAFPRSIAIVGLGLLGGSVARAIRRIRPDVQLIACARAEATREYARKQDIADVVTDDVLEAAKLAELAVIATPADRIAEIAIQMAAENENLVLTDVGSTKGKIVSSVASVTSAASRFVAAHPIAGSEKSGVHFSKENLFDRRPIVLTPSGMESAAAVKMVENFWRATGGRLVTLTPELHDTHLAATSHLPHLLSALAARHLPPDAAGLVGSGWLDTTRVAAGDSDMWTAIVSENRDAILQAVDAAQSDWSRLRDLIAQSDDEGLHEWLEAARKQRLDATSKT